MKSLKENGTSRLVHEKAWRRSKDLKGKKIKAEFQKTVMLSIYILVFTIPYGIPHTSLIPKVQVASRVWLIHSQTLGCFSHNH
jgi:hypothetical protein